MNKNKKHRINSKAMEIARSFYAVARNDGAMMDGKIPLAEINRRGWAKMQNERASYFTTRILADVVSAAIRPYEKAVMKYAHHLPECSIWMDDRNECDCGLEYIKKIIKGNITLEEE